MKRIDSRALGIAAVIRNVIRNVIATALALGIATPALADVRLPRVIDSHMVLQRDKPLAIWGQADPGERVTVTLAGATRSATANDSGEWSVTLPAMAAGGPHTMTVAGNTTLTLTDILIGEVWVGSGQSNMQWSVAASANRDAEIAAADFPRIRLFLVPNVLSGIPKRDVNATWTPCSPASIPGFSAVLYYFGRHLHRELDVPVGLIASAWGGSRIEPWTPPPGFAGVERLADLSETVRKTRLEYLDGLAASVRDRPEMKRWVEAAARAARNNELAPVPPEFEFPPHPLAGWPSPTSMFNAMIHPVVPFTLRGAIWYQGESNLADGMLYAHKMRALVEGWRKVWKDDTLSFYWAQLAPFNYGGDPHRLPRIWEAQRVAMSMPRTGMAVITDIGNLRDIHPRNKQDVGRRLALWALAKDYGREIVHSGPIYRSMEIEEGAIRVHFDHVGSGLESRDGKALDWFEIAGDGDYVPARAVIDGATVVVSSESVPEPTAVRFAWSQLAEPNLRNREGLPACPFRTTATTPTISGKRLFVDRTTVTLECLESEGVIRYTTDGSTPTVSSPVYAKAIDLDETTTVRARFFREEGTASAAAVVTFTRVQPRRHDGKTLGPGLRYEYYEGSWQSLPDFDTLKPAAVGLIDELTIAPRRRNDNFAFRFTGWVDITTPGRYTFHLSSDDGSKLWIDGREVVDNDGVHPVVSKSGSVELAAGLRRIVVAFFEAGGGEEITVTYEGPDVSRGAIPTWCERK